MLSRSFVGGVAVGALAAAALLLRRRRCRDALATVTTDVEPKLQPGSSSVAQLDRLLSIVENVIVPLTARGVERGNKVFGGAILRASDLSLVNASTNREADCPLWHGETTAIRDFFALPKEGRPPIGDCVMLATHEPCSMCASAAAFSGVKHVFFLFSYEDSRDSFSIPHDLKILRDVFGVTRPVYPNAFFDAWDLRKAIREAAGPEGDRLRSRMEALNARYAELNDVYQRAKVTSDNIALK